MRSESLDSDDARPAQIGTLHEAAYKLAQERLARLHDEHQKNREFQEYYGANEAQEKRSTRLGKLRRRASIDKEGRCSISDEDQPRSRPIRTQKSMFSTRPEVDETKRSRDREALIAAAQRNVRATLADIDEKLYRETGRVSNSKLTDWEHKRTSATKTRGETLTEADVTGEVNVGGGKYVDQEEVDELAARRVQPILDELDDRAELEREKVEAKKEEKERKRLESETKNSRNAEIKGECFHSCSE